MSSAAKQLQARGGVGGGELGAAMASSSQHATTATQQEEPPLGASGGKETETRPASFSAAVDRTNGGQIFALRGAPAGGNLDLGQGVRVIATGPKQQAAAPQVAHTLWLKGYDAALEGASSSLSCHLFLLCDHERFQPCQPRYEVGLKQLTRLVGYKNAHSMVKTDLRLAQDWQSAPGGPVHAQGMRLHKVGGAHPTEPAELTRCMACD